MKTKNQSLPKAWIQILALIGFISTPAFAHPALSPGEVVPDFKAQNQEGKEIQLSQFRGKPVLIYFYPKDDTPGCTKEACQFRDNYADFQKAGAVILGVSRQGKESHRKFQTKHRIPFDLLIDPDGKIADKLGVGTVPILGFHKRQSLLIDRDGKLVKFYPNVNPSTHTQEVLQDIKALKR